MAMTTPTTLLNDSPKIHYWGSTAPYEVIEEDNQNLAKAPFRHYGDDQAHSDTEKNSAGDDRSKGEFSDEADHEVMETIFADPSLEFVMIPANVYGESQDSNYSVESWSKDQRIEEHNNNTSAHTEMKTDSIIRTILNRLASCVSSEVSPREAPDKTQSSFYDINRRAPSRSSTIYSSYDWVSEVVVDHEGRRLILPGELVVMDANPHPIQENMFPDSSPEDASRTVGTESEYQYQYAAAVNRSRRRADLSSIFETSTIMVSAHDLLATQNKNTDEYDEMDFERIPKVSPHSSLMIPGYHTATMSTKIVSGLRRFALQNLDRMQTNFVCTTSQFTHCVTSQLRGVETHYKILATVTDLAIQGCDWLFPTNLRELEDCTGAPSDPVGNAYVSIEMAMLEEKDGKISVRRDDIDEII